MRKKHSFIFFMIILFVSLVTGCEKKSSMAELELIIGFESVNFQNRIANLIVEKEIETFDYQTRFVVSENATYKIFTDSEFKNQINQINLQIGNNTYFLKVTAEDGISYTFYQINIKRLDKFVVTYSSGPEYSFKGLNNLEAPTIIRENDDLKFLIEHSPSYEVKVYINGIETQSSNGVYTFRGVKTNISVDVNVKSRQYSVNFPLYAQRIGYIISNFDFVSNLPTSIEHGVDLNFRVNKDDNFEGTFIVKNNDEVIFEVAPGIYKVSSVTQNVNISVDNSNLRRKSFPLTYNTHESFDLLDSQGNFLGSTVSKGLNFTFRVVIKEGYIGNLSVRVNNGVPITCEIDADCTLTVGFEDIDRLKSVNININYDNISRSRHNVYFSSNSQRAFLSYLDETPLPSDLSIENEKSFSFKVVVNNGFFGNYFVSIDGKLVQPVEGIYTIDNIKDNHLVMLDASQLYLKFKIEYPFERFGYTISPTNGDYSLPFEVNEGQSFSFAINKKEGYSGDLIVRKNGEEIQGINGIYTISGVFDDIIISVDVSTIERISYTITYPQNGENYQILSYENYSFDQVYHGEDAYFRVMISEGYINQFEIESNYGSVVCDTNNICIIRNVKNNLIITIDVSQVVIQSFSVIVPEENIGYQIKMVSGEIPTSVNYGDSLFFVIEKDEEYYEGDLIVRNGFNVITPSESVYAVTNINKIVNISVDTTRLYRITYDLNFSQGDGYELVLENGNNLPDFIYKSDVLRFTARKLPSHNGNFAVSINDGTPFICEEISCDFAVGEMGVGITSNISISIDNTNLSIKTFDVSVNYSNIDRAILKTLLDQDIPSEINYGDDLAFKINYLNDYKGEVIVRSNNIVIEKTNGLYNIKDVVEDLFINIDTSNLFVAYNVTLPLMMEGYQILEKNLGAMPSIVYKNDSLSFVIEKLEGYDGGIVNVKINNQIVSDVLGVYTIENITSDITISVESTLSIIIYSVNFTPIEENSMFEYIGDLVSQVEYGDSVEFYLKIKSGYEGDLVVDETIANYQIENQGYQYRIMNVKSNLNIQVDDSQVFLADYNIIFPSTIGFRVVNADGGELPSTMNIQQALNFKIEKDDYYEGTILVYANGIQLMDNGDIYSITGVDRNLSIYFDTTSYSLKKYSISYNSGIGFEIENTSGGQLPTIASHGTIIEFVVGVKNGYFGELDVYINNQMHPIKCSLTCNYSVGSVGEDISIYVDESNLEYKVYSISYNTIVGVKYLSINASDLPSTIVYGENLYFKVSLEEGYQGNYSVYYNNQLINKDLSNVYFISSIESDVILSIVSSDIEKITYQVSYSSGSGYAIESINDIVEFGDNMSFVVTYENEYDGSSSLVTNNNLQLRGEKISSTKYQYTISNIKLKPNIYVLPSTYKYNVYFPNNQLGYEVEYYSLKANYNQNYVFNVKYLEGFDFTSAVVTYNGNTIYDKVKVSYDSETYQYTVRNVKGDISIDVSVTPIIYKLSLSSGEGYDLFSDIMLFDYQTEVIEFYATFDDTFSFNPFESVKYKQGDTYKLFSVSEVKQDQNNPLKYKYAKNVEIGSGDIYVYVDVEKITYNASFSGIGFNVLDVSGTSLNTKINKGDNFSFKLTKKVEFNGTMTVTYNNQILQGSNGIYTINNVNNDILIIVSGLSQGDYATINYGKQVGYTIVAESGYDKSRVNINSNFKFKIFASPNYDISSVSVTYAGQTLVMSNGVYTITNVTQSDTIIVSGVMPIYMSVIFAGEGILFTDERGDSFTSPLYVSYGSSLRFKVQINKSYLGNIVISQNGNIITSDSYGVYTINNIISSVNILGSGLILQNYSINYVSGTGYSFVSYNDEPIKQSIQRGDSIAFGVKISQDYQASETFKVTYAGKNINYTSYDEGNDIYYYQLHNILEQGNINVSGLKTAQYQVVFENIGYTSNLEIVDSYGNILKNTVNVVHGQVLKFKPESIYWDTSKLSIRYYAGSNYTLLNKEQDGYYRLDIQYKKISIYIENLVSATYSVSVLDGNNTLLGYAQNIPPNYLFSIPLNVSNHHNYDYYYGRIIDGDLIVDISNIRITKNLIIYAKLKSNSAIITFKKDINDPSPYIVNNFNNQFDWDQYSSEIDEEATRSGYIFKGWKTINGANSYKVSDNTSYFANIGNNITFYADYKENYSIVLNPLINGYGVKSVNVNNENYKNIVQIINLEMENIRSSQDGYILKGWYSNTSFEGLNFGTYQNYDQSMTLYAKWILDYQVNFNTGGKGIIAPLQINKNNYNSLSFIPNPLSNDYLFIGWYLDNNFTLNATIEDIKKSDSDITLYAKWQRFYPDNNNYLIGRWLGVVNNKQVIIEFVNNQNRIGSYYYREYLVEDGTYTMSLLNYNSKEIYYIGDNIYMFGFNQIGEQNPIISFIPEENKIIIEGNNFYPTLKKIIPVYSENSDEYLFSLVSNENGYLSKPSLVMNNPQIIYYYLDPQNMVQWNFNSLAHDYLEIYGYQYQIKRITINFYNSSGATILSPVEYLNIYDGDDSMPSPQIENSLFLGWKYNGRTYFNYQNLIFDLVSNNYQSNQVSVVSQYYQHQDYSGDPIIGSYIFSSGENQYYLTLESTGVLISNGKYNFWYKDYGGNYYLNIDGETISISFIKGEYYEDDSLLVYGIYFERY